MKTKYLEYGLSIGNEGINTQGKSKLYKEIVKVVYNLLSKKDFKKRTLDKFTSDLNKVIQDNTGLLSRLEVDPTSMISAYVFPPDIDVNNPVLNEYFKVYKSGKSVEGKFNKDNKVLKGSINRANSTVSGLFTKIKLKLYVTKGLLTSGIFNSNEITSIILHEIGHGFTYLEYLGTYVSTNFAIQDTTRRLMGTQEEVRKYKILEETEELLDIKLKDKGSLLEVKNEVVIQSVILEAKARKLDSEYGSETYDMTGFEQLADQFATHHGAGRHLVTGLAKLYKHHSSRMSENEFKSYQVTLALWLTTFSVFTFGILPLLLLFIDPTKEIYDKPEKRMKRISQSMIIELKHRNTSEIRKKELLKDIKVVNEAMSKFKDRFNFLERFLIAVKRPVKNQLDQKQFQHDVEDMLNNDLFVVSQKFKTLN